MSSPKKNTWGGARNYPKYRAEKRIVAALKKHGPMTARELAPLVCLAPGAVPAKLRVLKKGLAGFPRVRIADYEPPAGAGSHTPMYALGDAPDAAIVPVGRNAPGKKRFNRHATRDALLMELASNGPMTMHELAENLGRTVSAVWRIIVQLKKGVAPLARVRVAGYERVGTSGQQTPRYALGNAFDVKRVKLTHKQRNERTTAKYGAVIEARRTGRTADPFDQLLKAAA
jgi:DNA-binding Lrp family transcriptional regulator